MAKMKRISLSVSKEIENKVIELRKTDQFCMCSYSEIMRRLLEEGIKHSDFTKPETKQTG